MTFQLNDQEQMANLTHDSRLILNPKSYKAKQFVYLTDSNSGVYNNQVIFTLNSVNTTTPIVLADAVLAVPLKITGATFTANSRISFKNSACSLFSGISLTTQSGQPIVNEQDSALFLNNIIRNTLETCDYEMNDAVTYHYTGIERSYPIVNSAFYPASVVSVSAGRNAEAISAQTAYNPTLGSRARLFVNSVVSGAIEAIVYIPLRKLHPVFECFDFPLIRSGLVLKLTLSTSQQISPFLFSSESDVSPSTLTVTYGNVLSLQISGGTMSSCQLFYPIIDFNEHQSKLYDKMIQQKETKTIQFLTSILANSRDGAIAASLSGSMNSHQISSSLIKPVSCCVLSMPSTSLSSTTDLCIPNSVSTYSNVNLKLNGSNLYMNNQIFAWEQFNALKEANSKTQLNLQDYTYGGNTFLFFDLSRKALFSDNSSQQLSFSCNYTAAATFKTYFIVNQLKTLLLRFDSNSVVYLTSEGT